MLNADAAEEDERTFLKNPPAFCGRQRWGGADRTADGGLR